MGLRLHLKLQRGSRISWERKRREKRWKMIHLIMNKMIKNTNIAVNTPMATHCLRSKTNKESNITCVTRDPLRD